LAITVVSAGIFNHRQWRPPKEETTYDTLQATYGGDDQQSPVFYDTQTCDPQD